MITKTVMNDWEFGGVRLSTLGIVTELTPYLDMPPKRGDNIQIPMRHGRVWVPKYYDQRILSFGMEIHGDNIVDLEQKMDIIKALFGSRAQQTLRHYYCDGQRTAMAEVMNQLQVTRDTDTNVAKIVVDFQLADPFFRSSTPVHQVATMDVNPYTFTLNNPGTAEERAAILKLTGTFTDVVITNTTNGVVMEFTGLYVNPDYVTVDCGAYTAVDNSAVNVVGDIIHSGDTAFMVLVPGDNIFTIEDSTHANLFTVDFDFFPPYL